MRTLSNCFSSQLAPCQQQYLRSQRIPAADAINEYRAMLADSNPA
jgi:hypothetical protein